MRQFVLGRSQAKWRNARIGDERIHHLALREIPSKWEGCLPNCEEQQCTPPNSFVAAQPPTTSAKSGGFHAPREHSRKLPASVPMVRSWSMREGSRSIRSTVWTSMRGRNCPAPFAARQNFGRGARDRWRNHMRRRPPPRERETGVGNPSCLAARSEILIAQLGGPLNSHKISRTCGIGTLQSLGAFSRSRAVCLPTRLPAAPTRPSKWYCGSVARLQSTPSPACAGGRHERRS